MTDATPNPRARRTLRSSSLTLTLIGVIAAIALFGVGVFAAPADAQSPPVELSATPTESGVDLALSNFSGEWVYKIGPRSPCQETESPTVSVPGYLSGAYTVKAYGNSADCLFERDSLAETAFGSGPAPSLAASASDGVASLTLSNYDHDWWYSIYDDEWEGCEKVSNASVEVTSVEVRGYGKPRYSVIFINASSDSGCVSSIAYESLAMPITSLSASVNGAGEASLTLNNFAADWWYAIDGGSCVQVSGKTASGITGLQSGTRVAKAYGSANDCGADRDNLGETTFSTGPPPSLSASVSDGAISLSLSNYTLDWWYHITGGDCVRASGQAISGISGYAKRYNWTLIAGAYPTSSCVGDAIDSTILEMPAIRLSATVADDRSVSLTLANYGAAWHYKIDGGNCSRVSTNTVAGISGIQPGERSAKAYGSADDCGNDLNTLGETAFTVPSPPVALSATPTESGVDLALSNFSGEWVYKIGPRSPCQKAKSPTVSVPGYLSGAYTVKAYGNSANCLFERDSLAETAFGSGPAPSLAASASDGVASLTISNYDHDWWYSIYDEGWSSCEKVSDASVEVRGYGKPRYWIIFISASSDSRCVSSIAYASLAMPITSLSASVNDAGEASLTLNNFAADWWYAIDGGDCVQVVGRTASGITGLQSGTRGAKAYRSANDCNDDQNALGETAFTVLYPPAAAPTGLAASGGDSSVALSWDDPLDSSITGYQYRMRWAGVAWSAWTTIPDSDSSTTSYTFDGLDSGTEYRFRLRAVNGAGAGATAPNFHPWFVAVTTKDSPPPSAPAGLNAAGGDGSVALSWDDPSDSSITGYQYRMRWAGVAWSAWTAIPNSDSSTTSYTLNGLDNGTEYRFRLRAANGAGTGATAPNSHPWFVAATPEP